MVSSEIVLILQFVNYFKHKGGKRYWPRTLEQANETRDGLAKAIYSRLFGWIVKSLNHSLDSQNFR
jgi:myosin heavy subunit